VEKKHKKKKEGTKELGGNCKAEVAKLEQKMLKKKQGHKYITGKVKKVKILGSYIAEMYSPHLISNPRLSGL
jgi:hypothetical protein